MTKPPSSKHKPKTRLVHLGRDNEQSRGFVNPPLYRGSTVLFPTMASLKKGGYGYWYGRKGSPTYDALETAISDLEEAEDTVLTPSGLSAISTALLSFLKAGDHVLVTDSAYLPTRQFCDGTLKGLGIETSYYDPRIGAGIEALITDSTQVIFLESPGSQTFEVQDVPAIVKVARRRGITTIIDNTYATPLFFRPLLHGVDVSLHSGSKFFCGHADAMIGTISSNKTAAGLVRQRAYELGICAGPDDAQIALRGLRTLALRLEHHQRAALELASWLEGCAEVSAVIHPGLPSHPDHELFARDFQGSTSLFSIVLNKNSQARAAKMVDGLELFSMGWSWGGYESLIIPFDPVPYRTATKWPYEGQALRIHVGNENLDDLKADLTAGFERLSGSP